MTHSCPRRRSSDLARGEGALGWRGELRQGLPEAVAAQEERQDDAEAGEVAEEGDLQWRNCAAGQLRQHEHEGDEKGAEGDPAHRLREIARHGTQRLGGQRAAMAARSEEHTSELQSLMRISYAVFCMKKKK